MLGLYLIMLFYYINLKKLGGSIISIHLFCTTHRNIKFSNDSRCIIHVCVCVCINGPLALYKLTPGTGTMQMLMRYHMNLQLEVNIQRTLNLNKDLIVK